MNTDPFPRSPVAEPSTLALLACSAVVLLLLGRRRHRQRIPIEDL